MAALYPMLATAPLAAKHAEIAMIFITDILVLWFRDGRQRIALVGFNLERLPRLIDPICDLLLVR